jgi:predicted PurR-regulated permease PerM
VTDAPAKAIVRIVLIVVAVVICLYLIYRVRKPLGWVFISVFLAVALSGPVNALERHMRRGFAITIVYLVLLALPLGLMALIIPPLVTEANKFAQNVPQYSRDVTDYVENNDRLRKLNDDYNITEKLQQEAEKLPSKLGGAAKVLRDVGFGIVNSLFALVTILVLTAFLLGSGRGWVDSALSLQPPERRERVRRALDNMAHAVGGYVAGALTIAAIAGVSGYIVLSILGVPFRAPLAVILGLFSLIPLVGATIAAVLVGLVTLFANFPTATIAWAVWAILYQQLENHVIQPQIQRRTVNVHPFVVVVSVLMGASLLGILGAIIAIPVAASIQILLREWWDWRTFSVRTEPPAEPPPPPPSPATGAPGDEPAPA